MKVGSNGLHPCNFQLHSTQSPKDSLGEGSVG